MENLFCLRCNREIEVGHKSVAVYMFAQTVGIRPRQKSSAQRICFCPQCSVSLAMGPPPEGALNLAAWNMIRDLVGADPALNQAAWENLTRSGRFAALRRTRKHSTPGRVRRLLRVLDGSVTPAPDRISLSVAQHEGVVALHHFPSQNELSVDVLHLRTGE